MASGHNGALVASAAPRAEDEGCPSPQTLRVEPRSTQSEGLRGPRGLEAGEKGSPDGSRGVETDGIKIS